MLLVIQFPIADGRGFVDRRDFPGADIDYGKLRLRRPDFKNLRWDPPPEYLRYFGRAAARQRGRYDAWIDERAYCRAARAIRFVDLDRHSLTAKSISLPSTCAFRRVFGDGNAVVRVEIGVSAGFPNYVWRLKGSQCLDLARSFMRLPTKVRAHSDQPTAAAVYHGPAPLAKQGSPLAKLYRQATVGVLDSEAQSVLSRLVKPGLPLVVIEFEHWETESLPDDARVVDPPAIGGADLRFAYVRYGKDDHVPTWFLNVGDDFKGSERRRNIRLALLRLHAQRQVLNLVLNQIDQDFIVFREGTEAGDRLHGYLNAALTLVQKPGSYGISQSELWKTINDAEAAEAAIGAASHSVDLAQGSIDRERLLSRLTTAKGQLQRRIGDYATGLRPGTPVDVSDRLRDLLNQLPVAADFLGRSNLLDSIPGRTSLNRNQSNQLLDLELIVEQVIAIGPLDSGKHPIVTLIDNALPFAPPGSDVASALEDIRAAHIPVS